MSASVAALAAYKIQRWRYRFDRLGLAVDNICFDINATAEIACRYWLTDFDHEQPNRIKATEMIILGCQDRIIELIAVLGVLDEKLELDHLAALDAEYFDALTGGQFQVVGRPLDFTRARDVQSLAAQLNGMLRSSLARRMALTF